jgi:NAD(P)-dependent dehydrogenase (short-subunit alcohol dehydrogenase family)
VLVNDAGFGLLGAVEEASAEDVERVYRTNLFGLLAVVGEDDGIALPASMETRIADLRRLGTTVEYQRFPDVGHGFGTGVDTSAEGWIAEATRFWEQSR